MSRHNYNNKSAYKKNKRKLENRTKGEMKRLANG